MATETVTIELDQATLALLRAKAAAEGLSLADYLRHFAEDMNAQIEVREETAAKLQAIANALHLSLDEYLSRIAELVALPQTNGQEETKGRTPFELVEDLIGSVDSNLPDDPTAPPHRPPMYYFVAEKLRKQGLKIS